MNEYIVFIILFVYNVQYWNQVQSADQKRIEKNLTNKFAQYKLSQQTVIIFIINIL